MAAVGALDGAVAKALRSILDRVSVASKRSAVPKQVSFQLAIEMHTHSRIACVPERSEAHLPTNCA